MEKDYVAEIIKTIKELNWKVINIWVENNCIFGHVVKELRCEANNIRIENNCIFTDIAKELKIEKEGLYAGSDDDSNDVYNVFNKLKYALNFLNYIDDSNVLI